MKYSLSREDYIELYLCSDLHGQLLSKEECQRRLQDRYPCNTQCAVLELRGRGFDVGPNTLDYLIRKKEIDAPQAGEGRNRKWSAEEIDRVAWYLEEKGLYVPGTVARMFYNISPLQDMRAQKEAFAKNPQVGRDPSRLVMTIMPGAPGVGVYATVSYRAMTDKEMAQWEKTVDAANKTRTKQGKRNA